MLFRFLLVEPLLNGEYDYDNPKYLGSILHKDYVEYVKLLHFMKDMDCSGNLSLVEQVGTMDDDLKTIIDDEPFSVVDIVLRVPLDKNTLECVEVYVSEG